MQNENKYSRGSTWKKWDLHIHTPCSLNQEYGGDTEEAWDNFINDLELLPEEFKVIGINDYIFLDGYKKVVSYKSKGRLSNIDLILPVVELRIDKFGSVGDKGWKRVNFHIIFSNEITTEQIEQQFLNAIQHSLTLSSEYSNLNFTGVITRNSLIDVGGKIKESSDGKVTGSDISVGFNNITYSYEKILSALESTYFTDKFLTAVGKTEWDSLRWDSSIADKKTIINKANLVFISSETPEKFNNAKQKLKEQNVNYNLIDCSDAHNFSNAEDSSKNPIKDRIGKCFTWIKADPTFEGLRQIIYEPEERVKIQENNPEYEFDKPYFERITINDEIGVYDEQALKIKKNNLSLNKNLVAIIGGRGEGKSTIINYLGHSLNKIDNGTNLTSDEKFQIEHHKINDIDIKETDKSIFKASEKYDNQLNFVFIKQGELKENAKDDNLSSTLKDLLKLEETSFSKLISSEIASINNEINGIEKWKLDKDENGVLINATEFHEKIIKTNKALLENLKNSKNKEDIETYNDNLKKISDFKNIIYTTEKILLKTDDFVSDIDFLINGIDIFKSPDLKSYKIEIEEIKTFYISEIQSKNRENEVIKNSLLVSGLSGDLTTLLENTTKYQNLINEAEKSIVEINVKEYRLDKLKLSRSEFGRKIKEEYEKQKENIDNGWVKFLSKHPEDKKEIINKILLNDNKLVVSGQINFNKKEFYNILSESLNKNIYKDISDLEEKFGISTLEDWANFIENNFNEWYEKLNHKKQDFIDLFFSTEKRSKYLKTEAEIRYDGKKLNQLSAGQKGTAYLRIQLANSAFSEPIIFDQPEDDLDNKFIVGELINIFKELKKYRQIIIVTHNANLVVNADAEQVIIAINDNEKLFYISGSLENKIIQDHVCDILEGGKIAFEQRKKKYNLK